MQEDIIDSITLERRAEIIYAFLDAYTAFRNVPKDYGTGENFTMTQIHLLDYIDKNPGSTITDIAAGYRKSKGLVSQMSTAFERMGYLVRMADPQDAKKQRLFLTREGKQLNDTHLHYDVVHRIADYRYLRQSCSREEIDHFYKVMEIFTERIKSDPFLNPAFAAAAKDGKFPAQG